MAEDSGLIVSFHAPDEITLKGILADQKDPNQHSVVLKLEWKASSFVLPGDLGQAQWERLPKSFARHQMIKVPHHGSQGSISEIWTQTSDSPRQWVLTPYNRGRNAPPQP